MANTVFMSLRKIYLPLSKHTYKFNNSTLMQSRRFLYSKSTLGLDTFALQQQQIRNQMENIQLKFKEKMTCYADEESKNMIFTEDLKNMAHLAENDEDFNLVVRMMKKFNQQNKQLRFGNFVFGPVVMRLFHINNKPDLALECFLAPELDGFFDQLITYQILLDLLYENQKYQEILDVCKIIQDRQIQGTKYPRNVIVLAMGACYKMNCKESLDHALKLWQDLSEAGHFPMRRAATFCAGLALRQGKPEIALELLAAVKNQSYMTVRNLRVAALVDVGRVEDAMPILKSVIGEDQPNNVIHTFNRDVLERAKTAVEKLDDPDISLEFKRLETLFEKHGHVGNETLDQQLCSEIQKPPMINNRQENRYSRFDQGRPRPNFQRSDPRKPGLRDLN